MPTCLSLFRIYKSTQLALEKDQSKMDLGLTHVATLHQPVQYRKFSKSL